MQRISFGEGRYATPVWSPRGDLIAFTKINGGQFYIGVMRPDGSGERLLTNGFLVEGPTWAPNGRVLMFFRRAPGNSRGGGGRSRALHDRPHRLQRARGADAARCVRSGVVPLDSIRSSAHIVRASCELTQSDHAHLRSGTRGAERHRVLSLSNRELLATRSSEKLNLRIIEPARGRIARWLPAHESPQQRRGRRRPAGPATRRLASHVVRARSRTSSRMSATACSSTFDKSNITPDGRADACRSRPSG